MKYLIYIKAHIEVEAEDDNEAGKSALDIAREKATEKLNQYEGLTIDEAKVADQKTGFFIN